MSNFSREVMKYPRKITGWSAPQKEFGIIPYICNIHNIKVSATAFPNKFWVSYLRYLGLFNPPVAAPPISFFKSILPKIHAVVKICKILPKIHALF